jgi:acetyltransferase-like isoleucine patch superfamily enzyme
VKIGNGAVIGANSLVLNDVPENAIVGGSPAKVLRILERN